MEGMHASTRLLGILADESLDLIRQGAYRRGIPNLQEKRLQKVRKPRAVLVRVLHRHQDVMDRNTCTLRNCADSDWKAAIILIDDVDPTFPIKVLVVTEKILGENLCTIHVLVSDNPAGEILLQEVLQTEEHSMVEFTTTALQIGVNNLCIFWILQPVRKLVRICCQNRVVDNWTEKAILDFYTHVNLLLVCDERKTSPGSFKFSISHHQDHIEIFGDVRCYILNGYPRIMFIASNLDNYCRIFCEEDVHTLFPIESHLE
jgi:hypothetical protein